MKFSFCLVLLAVVCVSAQRPIQQQYRPIPSQALLERHQQQQQQQQQPLLEGSLVQLEEKQMPIRHLFTAVPFTQQQQLQQQPIAKEAEQLYGMPLKKEQQEQLPLAKEEQDVRTFQVPAHKADTQILLPSFNEFRAAKLAQLQAMQLLKQDIPVALMAEPTKRDFNNFIRAMLAVSQMKLMNPAAAATAGSPVVADFARFEDNEEKKPKVTLQQLQENHAKFLKAMQDSKIDIPAELQAAPTASDLESLSSESAAFETNGRRWGRGWGGFGWGGFGYPIGGFGFGVPVVAGFGVPFGGFGWGGGYPLGGFGWGGWGGGFHGHHKGFGWF